VGKGVFIYFTRFALLQVGSPSSSICTPSNASLFPHPVSIFPELGSFLESRRGGEIWTQFLALNPQSGEGVVASDETEFFRTIQAMSFLGLNRQQQLDILKTV
jgi:hypothetical protein